MEIGIVCDANNQVGYGHFMRCFALAEMWQSLGVTCRWYGDIDPQLVTSHSIKHVDFFFGIEQALALAFKQKHPVLLDSYLVNESQCRTLAIETVFSDKLIVVDDFANDTWQFAFAVLNFTVGATVYRYDTQHQLLGPRYFLANSTLTKQKTKSANDTTIMLGGYDHHQLGPKIANALVNHGFESVHLLGRYENLRVKGFTHSAYTDDMGEVFARSKLFISGGGLAKYEAAFLCVPNVVIAQNPAQAKESEAFDRLGLSHCYGLAQDVNPHSFATWLNRFDASSQIEAFATKTPFVPSSTKDAAYQLLELLNNAKK